MAGTSGGSIGASGTFKPVGATASGAGSVAGVVATALTAPSPEFVFETAGIFGAASTGKVAGTFCGAGPVGIVGAGICGALGATNCGGMPTAPGG